MGTDRRSAVNRSEAFDSAETAPEFQFQQGFPFHSCVLPPAPTTPGGPVRPLAGAPFSNKRVEPLRHCLRPGAFVYGLPALRLRFMPRPRPTTRTIRRLSAWTALLLLLGTGLAGQLRAEPSAAARGALLEGEQHVREKNHGEAVSQFLASRELAGEGDDLLTWRLATLNLAEIRRTHPQAGDASGIRSAESYYRELVDRFPHALETEEARVALARQEYEELRKRDPSASNVHAAAVRLAWSMLRKTFSSTDEVDRAERLCRLAAEGTVDPAVRARAYLRLGQLWQFNRRDPKSAIPFYREASAVVRTEGNIAHEIRYSLAIALQQMTPATAERITEATQLLEQVVSGDPSGQMGQRSMLVLGRLAEQTDFLGDEADVAAAREWYRRAAEAAPGAQVGAEATYRLGITYTQSGFAPRDEPKPGWDERYRRILKGVEILRTWALRYPDHPFTPALWEKMGECYYYAWMGDAEEERYHRLALDAFLAACGDADLDETGEPRPRKINLDRINAGWLYWRMGVLAQRQGRREVALEYYLRGLTEVETYNKGPEGAQQLRDNMGFSEEVIRARIRRQYRDLGRTPVEIEQLMADFSFLPKPWDGVPIPQP